MWPNMFSLSLSLYIYIYFFFIYIYKHSYYCSRSIKILSFDRAVNQETGASGRRNRNITLTCRWVVFGAHATPTGSRWMSNNRITRCHRRFELFGVRGRQSSVQVAVTVRVPVTDGDKIPLWEPAPDRGLGPSGPRLSSPAEWGRSAAIIQRNLGSICCSLFPSPTHLSHITNINPFATLSRIKCGRYIFLRKCVRSSLLLTMFPCIVLYVLCGYTTNVLIWNLWGFFLFFFGFFLMAYRPTRVLSCHSSACRRTVEVLFNT